MGVVLLRRGLHPLLYADSPSGLNKDIFNKALPITVHRGMLRLFLSTTPRDPGSG